MSLLQYVTSAALAFSTVIHAAPTIFSDKVMNDYLHHDTVGLAQLNAPVFFFGQDEWYPPCIPTWAYGGTPSTPDTYEAQSRTKPAARCDFPNVGCNCRNPGVSIGNKSPAFPVYYSVRDCSATEVRVALNLFYEKDGAICYVSPSLKVGRIDTGHDYDWERVVIVYQKDPYSFLWSASHLLMSQHSGFETKPWSSIQNTFTTQGAMAPDPRKLAGVQYQDHPAVYVAWDKHPIFDTKFTTALGWPFQSLKTAFRSDDWWYFVEPQHFIQANASTPAGQVMQTQPWGEASSIPPHVDEALCSVPLSDGFVASGDPNVVDVSPVPVVGPLNGGASGVSVRLGGR